MLKIENNTIYLTRGDSATLGLNITDAYNKPYKFVDEIPTTVTLSVKKSVNEEEYLFQKSLVNQDIITIAPEDTARLPFGVYAYDVQIECQGDVSTVIPPSKFYVCEEVTI